jgi:hypothetical protein
MNNNNRITTTLCIQPKYAKQLGLNRRRESHPLKLGDGSIIQEYAYAVGSSVTDVAVCTIHFEALGTGKKRKRESAECVLRDVYEANMRTSLGPRRWQI